MSGAGERQADPERHALRVGILCHRGIGGSVRMAIELSKELVRQGCAVHLFARSAPMGMVPTVGITLHTLVPGTAVSTELDLDWTPADLDAFVHGIVSAVEDERIDLLHFHYAFPFAEVLDRVGRIMGRYAPILVGTLHGTDVTLAAEWPAWRRTFTAALERLDAVTTVSQSHADLACRTFGLATAPRVIPNFVDTHRFEPRIRSAKAQAGSRLIHVSNFRAVKQPESMARIFVAVRRRRDATLWLVGDGSKFAEVRDRVSGAGFAGDLRHFGMRTDVEAILPDADVLLVTSREESFCLAALEAAACGVPVVAPRLGGIPEVVIDGHTGLLFEPDDEEQAADAIVRLFEDAALRAAMSRAAVEWARCLSASAIVPRYIGVYRDALATRRSAAVVPIAE